MSDIITMQEIDTAAAVVRGRISIQPKIALILGSGLGPLADEVESPAIIPTSEIPHWPVSTVQLPFSSSKSSAISFVDSTPVFGPDSYMNPFSEKV